MVVILGQQYNIGEKPTVILYTCINRHAGTPEKLLLFSSHQPPIGPQPYPVIYVVANPVRGLLDRKKSEEHLQSSNESKKHNRKQNKNDKKKETIIKYTCQKNIEEEGHSIERAWYSASREPSDTLPGSQTCTQTRSIYHTQYPQGFSFL